MKPPEFKYVAARTVDEAIRHLGSHGEGAKVLAGGQSLTPMLNFRLLHPEVLVDINRVKELDFLSEKDGRLRIGALTRHRTVASSKLISEKWPVLSAAAAEVAHPAIRNRGTFGGSVAHADPAAEFPMITMLLDAEMKIASAGGAKTIKARDFFVSYLTTALQDGEILTEIQIPPLPAQTGWGFEELSRRPGDFAIAAAATTLTMKGKKCIEARICMAGVGATALRAPAAEAMLKDQELSGDLLEKAAHQASEDTDPSNDLHASANFRRHVAGVLVRRVLENAAQRAGKV
jgi:CO/xanthine dehydrogenase FAD-binding subunit